MALDSYYKKKKIEDISKKIEDDPKKALNELKSLIDSLEMDEEEDFKPIKNNTDIDIKITKDKVKKEFSFTPKNKVEEKIKDPSYKPSIRDFFDNIPTDTNYKKKEHFVDYYNKMEDKYGKDFKVHMNNMEKEEFIKLYSDSNNVSPLFVREILENEINDINYKKEKEEEINKNKLKSIEKFTSFNKKMQNKYGMYYKAFMTSEEKDEYINSLKTAFDYPVDKIKNDLTKEINEIKNKEDYKKIVSFENKYKEKDKEGYKKTINSLNNSIDTYLNFFNSYMSIPKVNEQINLVIKRNNEINSKNIVSINDYKEYIKAKKELIEYLNKAQKFIIENTTEEKGRSYGYINILFLSIVILSVITFIIINYYK